MTTLLLAEHDNKSLKDSTNKALTAAKGLGGDVHVLVAGKDCRAVRQQHLLDAVELGRGIGHRLGILAGDEDMHVAAQRLGGGQRLAGRVLERLVVVLGDEKRGHQISPISFLSLSTSSPTVFTLTPALRPAGSVVLSTSSRGAMSTP